MIEAGPGRFEDMVVPALDGLPEEPGQLMRNVAVTVEHRPGPPGLLGLYEGIPLTRFSLPSTALNGAGKLVKPQRYVHHCHIVEHEDNDMMERMIVVP